MNSDGLIGIGEAAKILGTSQTTLRRRVRDGRLPTFVRPLDRRVRLIRASDVRALDAPRRLEPKEDLPVAG